MLSGTDLSGGEHFERLCCGIGLCGGRHRDRVLLVTGSAAARFSMEAPVDAAIVAILDPEGR